MEKPQTEIEYLETELHTREILQIAALTAFLLAGFTEGQEAEMWPYLLSSLGVLLSVFSVAQLELVIRDAEEKLYTQIPAYEKLAMLKRLKVKNLREYVQTMLFFALALAVFGTGMAVGTDRNILSAVEMSSVVVAMFGYVMYRNGETIGNIRDSLESKFSENTES